jgi:hypothetical protein
MFMQEFSVESKTCNLSSSSTSWQDLEARYKSSIEVNMTPRSPRTNPWRRKTPRTRTENAKSCGTRSFIYTTEKLMSRGHMQKGEYSRRLWKHHQRRRPRTGVGRPSPFRGPVVLPFDLAAIRTIYSPLADSHASTHLSFPVEEQRREGHHSR